MKRKFSSKNLNAERGRLILLKYTLSVAFGLTFGWVSADASDLLVPGNLEVAGVADILGDELTLGSSEVAIDTAGVSFTYSDFVTSGSSAFSLLKSTATRASHQWLWGHQNEDRTAEIPAMRLDQNHVLTIYDKWGIPAIVLDPSESSGFVGVLTQDAADDRYVKNSDWDARFESGSVAGPQAMVYDGGTAIGISAFAHHYATAIGYNASAGDQFSLALGTLASAPGYYASSIGSYAYGGGAFSSALGFGSESRGVASLSLGFESGATGSFGTALGFMNLASGKGATAAGVLTKAIGYKQFVVGAFNIPQGDPNNWVETDDLFIVGNGHIPILDGNGLPQTEATTGALLRAVPSNAFVVRKNGDAVVYGRLSASGGEALGGLSTGVSGGIAVGDQSTAVGEVTAQTYKSVVVGSWNDAAAGESSSNWIDADPIFVVGNGKDENHRSNALIVRKSGDVEMMAKVKMPRQGDILMGEFGNPEPQ